MTHLHASPLLPSAGPAGFAAQFAGVGGRPVSLSIAMEDVQENAERKAAFEPLPAHQRRPASSSTPSPAQAPNVQTPSHTPQQPMALRAVPVGTVAQIIVAAAAADPQLASTLMHGGGGLAAILAAAGVRADGPTQPPAASSSTSSHPQPLAASDPADTVQQPVSVGAAHGGTSTQTLHEAVAANPRYASIIADFAAAGVRAERREAARGAGSGRGTAPTPPPPPAAAATAAPAGSGSTTPGSRAPSAGRTVPKGGAAGTAAVTSREQQGTGSAPAPTPAAVAAAAPGKGGGVWRVGELERELRLLTGAVRAASTDLKEAEGRVTMMRASSQVGPTYSSQPTHPARSDFVFRI